jgi:hypothetical protein
MRALMSLLTAAGCCLLSPAIAATTCTARSAAQATPLVELYTSEGCSSCPPADRWLSQHAVSKDAGDFEANWLAFHVDYWNVDGWRDRFGSSRYSRRQTVRVNGVGDKALFTPQVMVGDVVRAPWQFPDRMRATIAGARTPAAADLTLRMLASAKGWQVQLDAARSAAAAPAGKAQIWLAQYSDDLTTQVRAGENKGVTLHHDRVVRQLWGPWTLDGASVSQRLSVQAPSPEWGLTAFVQDGRGRVWQSLSLSANACSDASGS